MKYYLLMYEMWAVNKNQWYENNWKLVLCGIHMGWFYKIFADIWTDK